MVMIDALGADKAKVLPLVTLVQASLVDVLVLRGYERGNGEQIGGGLARAQHHVPNATDE